MDLSIVPLTKWQLASPKPTALMLNKMGGGCREKEKEREREREMEDTVLCNLITFGMSCLLEASH